MNKHPEKLATLNDVAKAANVSTATVSRCLNNEDNVKEATRKRVMQAVESLGYSPNFGAKILAAKRSFIIGAIIPTMDNAIFASGIQAFQETLSQSGYTLLVSSSSYSRDLENAQIRNLVARGADALLLIGEDRDTEIYEFLNKRKIPYVLAWNYRADSPHAFIGFDNIEAAKGAAELVISFGHQNLGIIAGFTKENDRARDRLLGFKQACTEQGIRLAPSAICESGYSFREAGEALDRILENHKDITAIICGNDVLAVGAMMRAKELGITLPDEMSFIGFDDIEISQIISPPLTTIHVPHRQMGRYAAQALIQALEPEPESQSKKLDVRLIMRQSLKTLNTPL